MNESISATIARPATPAVARIQVPIVSLSQVFPLWSRAASAGAVTTELCADDPSCITIVVSGGWATWMPGMNHWVPTVVQMRALTYGDQPYWMDSPQSA
jgi:hypothetical protein